MAKKQSKPKVKNTVKKKSKEKPTKLNMSFEEAILLSLKTKVHNLKNNPKE